MRAVKNQSKQLPTINYIEPKIKYGHVVDARWNKFEWPMLLVYMIIFVLFIGVTVLICVCCCEKDPEEKEDEMGMEAKMMNMNEDMTRLMGE